MKVFSVSEFFFFGIYEKTMQEHRWIDRAPSLKLQRFLGPEKQFVKAQR